MTAQRGTGLGPWLASAATCGVTVVVLLACQGEDTRQAGPSSTIAAHTAASIRAPSGTPTHVPSATPTHSPSTAPMSQDLLSTGSEVQLEIQSREGIAGTITITRGDDIGGYPLVPAPSSTTHFFVELFATYELDVATETASWGSVDWRVEGENGPVHAELATKVRTPADRRPLGTWPGATVPEERYTGWMIFAVPREQADDALHLLYQPSGVRAATVIPLRRPGAAPAPVAAEWPRPAPEYVDRGGPFTVLESAEADALFVGFDTCANPEAGYTVSYPDSWYTNTAVGDIPACSWFSPTFYELRSDGAVPDEIAITIDVFSGAVGFIWVDLYSEEVMIDGFAARRYETGMTKDVSFPTDTFAFSYLSRLDDQLEGRKLWASTGTEYGGDYMLNRAVLDRIMASFEFDD